MASPQTPPPDVHKSIRPSEEETTTRYAHSIAETTSSDETADQIEALANINTRTSRISIPSLARKVTSIGTTGTTDPNYEVDWEDEFDRTNPKNWSLGYKAMGMFFLSYNTLIM